MSSEVTSSEVASFMKTQFDLNKCLYQEDIVFEIERKFGSVYIYINQNGNQAIDQKVLGEFNKITPDVVWDRGERCWRMRENSDQPGSRMQE